MVNATKRTSRLSASRVQGCAQTSHLCAGTCGRKVLAGGDSKQPLFLKRPTSLQMQTIHSALPIATYIEVGRPRPFISCAQCAVRICKARLNKKLAMTAEIVHLDPATPGHCVL
jgi:hypothetical protein